MKQGQISIEYLIITGVVLFLMVIPAAIFISSFSKETLFKSLSNKKSTALGADLVDNAQQTYYLGLFAKKRVAVQTPPNVERLYILTMNVNGKNEYYVVQIVKIGKQTDRFVAQSSVPIAAQSGRYIRTGVSYPQDVPECAQYSCSYAEITRPFTLTGTHRYDLETVQLPSGATVLISPVIA